jgi:hypothetical protein
VHPTRAAAEFRSTLLQLLSSAHNQDDLPAGVEFVGPWELLGGQSTHDSTSVNR